MQKKVDLILVPTDFSMLSCQAFSWAALFAQQFDAKILLVHVIAEPSALEMIEIPGNPWELVLEREDKAMIEEFQANLVADIQEEIEVETFVGVGPTEETLLETARKKEADIIVMATHGRTGLNHAVMGSCAEKVVRRAHCPVFTVKPKDYKI